MLSTGAMDVPQSRAALTWLPYLWSHVLFPGRTVATPPARWSALLALVFLPGLLLYPCLSFHLFEPDEGRYAEIPREMLARGEWVVPLLQGEPYLDKPPLLYWLIMVSYHWLGTHDWAARLVPALAVHGCILLTYWLGRRTLGEQAAFWGALMLALAPGFSSVGRLLVLDGLLAFFVWLSALAAFEALRGEPLRRGWWLLAAAACGLGVLTKGPIAPVLLVPPLLASRWLSGRAIRVSWSDLGLFGAVVLALNAPWYVAVCLRVPEFAGYFFWKHNVLRFLSPFDHLRPVWFYLPILAGGLLPATLLAWPFLRFMLSEKVEEADRRCPELGYFLLAAGWCVLFFSLSGSKLPTYVLPAFPPLALALGYYLASSRWARSRVPGALAVSGVLVMALGHYVAVPWYAAHRSPLSREEMVRAQCADPAVPVVCYPRACDSLAFYLQRDDFHQFRSKDTKAMIEFLRQHPRAVLLCTHRHSIRILREILPQNNLTITYEAPLFGSAKLGPEGDCYLAVVTNGPLSTLQARHGPAGEERAVVCGWTTLLH